MGQNRTDNTVGNHNKTVVGASNRTHIGPTSNTFVANHAVDHKADQEVQERVSYMHFIREKISKFFQKTDESHSSLFITDFFSSFVTVLYTDYRTVYAVLTPVVSASATTINLHLEAFDSGTGSMFW